MNAYLIYVIYLVVINLLAVILVVLDKNAACKHAWRIKERTLLIVSVLGGSAVMLLTLLAIRHKTRHAKFMAGIPLIILLQAAILVFVFNQSLSVSHYSVETDKINGQIKLALVTDLHACKYGYGQRELLNTIDEEAPDMILLCGDIFDDKLPPDRAIEFIEGVSRKYMCFYVSGNHEFWSEKVDEFKDILISCGVIVLAGKTEIVDVRSDLICIMGIDDPYVDKYISNSVSYDEQISRLSDHADNEAFTIMLSHRPERIYELLPLKADLIVSGHAHGGQWRIPYVLQNGLYAPNQGLFPKYTNGEYFFEDAELIVSRGLARESIPVPRVFNRPEIVIITLEQESF